jgi:enoyl-CoA hydratase
MIHKETFNDLVVLRLEHGKVSALDLELLVTFREYLIELRRSPCRGVVLTGTGSSFSAGVDLRRVLEGRADYLKKFLPALDAALQELFEFPRPVIAAVNGHAIAGGCIVACACDYKIMADGNGRIGVTELLVGVPFPAIPLEILRSCVSPQHFQRAVYTGQTYTPQEAVATGLIDEVSPPESLMTRALERAGQLSSLSPSAFAVTKSNMRRDALERARRSATETDATVAEIWSTKETLQMIEEYLARTIRKK